MRKRNSAILVISLFLIFSIFLFGYLGPNEVDDNSLKVEGAVVINESKSKITLRSFSPGTEIEVKGFKGDIKIKNCLKTSKINGIANYERKNYTTILLDIDSKQKKNIEITVDEKTEFKFGIIGDTQGLNDVFEEATKKMDNLTFLIHCGDLTPAGEENQFRKALKIMEALHCPVYTTMGNHDIKSNGREFYKKNIAPNQYSFNYSNHNFVFLDSSKLSITQEQIDWAESQLSSEKKDVLITHAPYFDPFNDSHTVLGNSSEMVSELVQKNDIDITISGHIHAFYQDTVTNTKRLITGGGGASLVKGNHHFVIAELDQGEIEFKKTLINSLNKSKYVITVKNGEKVQKYSYNSLLGKINERAISSFQNQFGNKRGTGYYEGIRISKLLEKVGGMSKNETLIVKSKDGYRQRFGYLNVYPNEKYLKNQGKMVLSLKYNNETIETWEEGPRLVMLPKDGYYTNKDCANTSYEGQGWNIYESAGARWAKYVKKIMVVNNEG